MKLRILSSVLLFALTIPAFANQTSTAPLMVTTPGKFYLGAFGGGGSSNNFNATQYGTAYFLEAAGGPLAVNAFGQLNNQSVGFWGAQIGYKAKEIIITPCSQWTLVPAVELEGLSMGSNTFSAHLINNTDRVPEHDFSVSYPMSRTVFLANVVVGFNHPRLMVTPYVGLGFGDAILRISGADSTQISPPEVGINHYNTSASDTNSVFAGQIKLGLSYDFNQYVSLFADYRWVYLASSHFVFGSTVYPTHVQTSPWQVKLDAQNYNLGNVGIRFSL